MTPIQQAKKLYQEHVKEPFEVALGRYLSAPNGAVISAPNCFVMGWAVQIEGKDAWYVDAAVGKLCDILALMPYQLPFIAFKRGKRSDKLRIYPRARLERLAK